jgi:hypothetical protein
MSKTAAINDVEEAIASKGRAPEETPEEAKDRQKKQRENNDQKTYEPPRQGGWKVI